MAEQGGSAPATHPAGGQSHPHQGAGMPQGHNDSELPAAITAEGFTLTELSSNCSSLQQLEDQRRPI